VSLAPSGSHFLNAGAGIAKAAAQAAGTLRVGWTPPVSLDPALFADAPDISVGISVYDYLLMLDPDSAVVPHLAKSWTISDDGKTYTFTLESGVKFHDGSDFGAADVKFTFDRLRDEKVGSAARSLFSSVTNIEAPDATTVVFTLSEPSAVFLKALTDYHACVLKNGIADPTKEFIGTGPFKLESIDVTDRASFVANTGYWKQGQPKVAALELVFAKDTVANVQAVQGGQLDWVSRVPIEQYLQLQSDSNLVVTSVATNQFPNIRIRADRGPGQDVRVRQALKYATNREKLNEIIYRGLATLGNDSPVGPLYGNYYSEAAPVLPHDPAKAKELLKEAGFTDGITLDFYGPKGEFNSDELVQALAEQWKEAGITINIQLTDASIYYSDAPNNWLDADLGVTNWASRPDPQSYLELAFKSDGIWNEAHWADAELDQLIATTRTETDDTKRAAAFAAIQKVFIERGPSIIPFFQPALAVQRAAVKGITLAADPGLTSFATAEVAS
jgi:peptide/nickel transport system substrate-binding protein